MAGYLFWYFGILVFWYFGILVFWYFGILVFWYFGILVMRFYIKKDSLKTISALLHYQ